MCCFTGNGRAYTAAMQHEADEMQQMPEAEEVQLPMEERPQDSAAAAADIDLPDHTANDIFMLEEEIEVERYCNTYHQTLTLIRSLKMKCVGLVPACLTDHHSRP